MHDIVDMLRARDLNQQRATPVFSAFRPATNYTDRLTLKQNQQLEPLVQISDGNTRNQPTNLNLRSEPPAVDGYRFE